MKRVYTFHQTVKGYNHIIKNTACEDFSDSFSSDDKDYQIVVVADGHGASQCCRSKYGSQFAVESAMEQLKVFAEAEYGELHNIILEHSREQRATLKRITDSIIAEWYDKVTDHFSNHPIQLSECGEDDKLYKKLQDSVKNPNNIPHLYGTTLIAALKLPNALLLIQQGDGRCQVVWEDGTFEQPIPWDDRCVGNITTSMCDFDAIESIRTCVINPTKKKVVACYLGTDGVEDAYRDTYESLGGSHVEMGGVYTFYKNLSCEIADKNCFADEPDALVTMLSEFSAAGLFSKTGSGDDVSVAGFVDVDRIKPFLPQFKLDIRRYDLEEQLFWKQVNLRSRKRKHDILEKRYDDAAEALRQKYDEQEQRKREASKSSQQVVEQKQAIDRLQRDLDKLKSEIESSEEFIPVPILCPNGKSIVHFIRVVVPNGNLRNVQLLEKKIGKEQEKLLVLNKTNANKITLYQNCEEDVARLQGQIKKAQNDFDMFDKTYQAINNEIRSLEQQLSQLSVTAPPMDLSTNIENITKELSAKPDTYDDNKNQDKPITEETVRHEKGSSDENSSSTEQEAEQVQTSDGEISHNVEESNISHDITEGDEHAECGSEKSSISGKIESELLQQPECRIQEATNEFQ